MKVLFQKILFVLLIGFVIISVILCIYFNKFYKSIFRVSADQIANTLAGTKTECSRIKNCELLPGDILLRRYITSRTWLVDKFAHPYFTHSAFYLGDNEIVEAVGTEKNPEDDIQVEKLQATDWMNSDLNDFVIVRPKNYSSKLITIENNLKNIAEDPDYFFGLPENNSKKSTCSDLIFEQLANEGVIQVSSVPNIITPDYLFWLATNNPGSFEIIGYNLQK